LIKQAHPDWSPDFVRTALINTATNLRQINRSPKADGLSSDSIIAQGGGLIDVYNAVHTKALMGVGGDGIVQPSILGSYSFGAVPVINSRVTHTETKTVTIQDLSGQDSTYNLAIANNRDLEMSGITATISSSSVSVPANGAATFTVSATVDGNVVRDINSALEMQFYVVAQNAGGAIRMPFYMQLLPTVPQGGASLAAINDSGTILVGDDNSMLVEGIDSQSFPVVADAPGAAIDVTMTFDQAVDGAYPDLDLYLYDPAGNEVTHSGNGGGPEHIATTLGAAGTYTLRASGWVNANTDFTIAGTISRAAQPPVLQAITGEFTDAQGNAIDFDGAYTLNWQHVANAQKYEVEQSSDGTNFSVLGDFDASVNSLALTGQSDGTHSYRVRALTPGQIGYYVTPASGVQSITVSSRTLMDITSQVKTAVSNLSLNGGVFSLDLTMTNQSSTAYVPYVKLNVIGITSGSGTVRLTNAENGGSGLSPANAGLFDYTNKLGADQIFSGGETTAARTMRFADSASELFQFDVNVTAYLANSTGAGGSATPQGGGGSGTQSSNALPVPGVSLQSVKQVMRITVNPLTKSVTSQLVLK
jgi:hypothetical protein